MASKGLAVGISFDLYQGFIIYSSTLMMFMRHFIGVLLVGGATG